MLLRIDVGKVRGMLLHEMEMGRCYDSHIVLKRRVIGDVIDGHSRPAAQYLAVVVAIRGPGFGLRQFGLGCLAPRGPFRARARSRGRPRQRRSLLEEPPPSRSVRIPCLPPSTRI